MLWVIGAVVLTVLVGLTIVFGLFFLLVMFGQVNGVDSGIFDTENMESLPLNQSEIKVSTLLKSQVEGENK